MRKLSPPAWLDLPFLAAGFGGAFLIVAFIGLVPWYLATHNRNPIPDGSAVVTYSTDRPDETSVAPDSEYSVAPDQPRSISLPSIKAGGLIQKVGVDQHKAVAVPGNVSVAGWFTGSVRPGAPGVALIDGHVQGKYTAGIFKRLKDIKPGQRFSVVFGDKSVRTFEVVRITSLTPDQTAARMLEPADGLASQLNLVTCDGAFDKASGQYAKRLLVISKLADD